ncbi:MAG TPA: DUF5063 domain-containing protein [Ornithinimicrobium sp.]|uniref:DUF5063 domain-containing protein n=1 Tax=Ornithinimicrobium sp. TaxID=1977084 RepID=UPI002B4A6F9A|nr:DUF5063 domain-containing protein [Ornithinimicrobium sp.]HKJ12349.1 DUF5063 domain-containing protein [Ornithinimicrobium sp.]
MDTTEATSPGPHPPPLDAELWSLAHETATEARTYLETLQGVARGGATDSVLPVLLLALSQVQVAGARLGAMVDVVPVERYEPDSGPDLDLDGIREDLVRLLAGVDDYAEVTDPVALPRVGRSDISGDLVAVAADLSHGLRHYADGAVTEALWWWQFSYLSSWGDRSASSLRAVLALLAHVRLDADEETVMEAEMAALHAE